MGDWEHDHANGRLETNPRGRPCQRPTRETRAQVIDIVTEVCGRIGVPTLRSIFPNLSRRALRRLLQAYRRLHRARHARLEWTLPGTVWAADYTEPAHRIDGRYRYVLSVRDLASSAQLLALPLEHATAHASAAALAELFARHGPPLVLKTDNGGHFTGSPMAPLLAAAGVAHLRSPPRTPRYNGSVEAGIGSLDTRLYAIASMHGRVTSPTCDDLEHARREANAEARPWGPTGPSPELRWNQRSPITADQRRAFTAAIEIARAEETRCFLEQQARSGRGQLRTSLNAKDRVTVARRAIRHTLVACGNLIIHNGRSATSSTQLNVVLTGN